MNTVYLHGSLGRRFGKKWEISAKNSYDIIKGLDANNEGFIEYIAKQTLEGNQYFLLSKHPKKIKTKDDFLENIIQAEEINSEVHIVPQVYGGVISSWLITTFSITSAAGIAAAGAISGMIWGGLAQIAIGALNKTPDQKPISTPKSLATKSFLLSASSESASQSGAVPVGYGRMLVGPCLIGQSMKSYLRKNNRGLESQVDLTFNHLLCEGPIEGPVGPNGYILDLNADPKNISDALYINNVPLKKGDFYNFNLNEKNIHPFVNLGDSKNKLLGEYASAIYGINQKLHGVAPYFDGRSSATVTIQQALDNATIFSNKIRNLDVNEVAINFETTLFSNNGKGTTTADSVYFAIFVVDENGNRVNVLDSPNAGNFVVPRHESRAGIGRFQQQFYVNGTATSSYQFQIILQFIGTERFQNQPPIIQIVKTSKETDAAAAAAVYSTWTTSSRAGGIRGVMGGRNVQQHEKTTYNAVGGQGRSRSISVVSMEERIYGKFCYPNSATSYIFVDSINFSRQPEFQWHLKLKKVLIPSNYNPTTREYDGPWNGLFKGQNDSGNSIHSIDESNKFWTDNPAWVFYDLVSNPIYGCGKYGIEEANIDKWQLYKIAKYCDELVETHYPIETVSGLPDSFELLSLDSQNNGTFQIKIDNSIFYYDNGSLSSKSLSASSGITQTYFEYEEGDHTLTIPNGVESIDVVVIGAGGSGQNSATKGHFHNGVGGYFVSYNGNNGGFSSITSSSSNWSIKCLGGRGGGQSPASEELIQITGQKKVWAKVNGLHWDTSRYGRDRLSSSDGRIVGEKGSKIEMGQSPKTPGSGAGSSAATIKPNYIAKLKFFLLTSYIKYVDKLYGGGSGSAAAAQFKVSPGDTLNITAGKGGSARSSDAKSMFSSPQGGAGKVIVRYNLESGFIGYSDKEKFIRNFGDGESLKGKTMAFFIHQHNLGNDAINHKQELQEKSVLRKKCTIERRQIVSSDPENFTVTLAGKDFSENKALFYDNSGNPSLYGACAVEINHPIVEPRFTANFLIKEAAESVNILNMFANLFRSRLSYSSGLISLQQDSRKIPMQMYNNTNVEGGEFSYSGTEKSSRFSAVKVFYKNKNNEFQEKYVYEEDPSAMLQIGVVEKEVTALSITSESEARRYAKWILLSSQYEQEMIRFKTGNEGLLTFPGSVIEIFDEMRSGNLRSGRILDVDLNSLVLDQSILKEPMVDHIELTVSVGADNVKKEYIDASARNEKSELDQDYDIENVNSPQLLLFNARIIPDVDESKSRAVDLVLKMRFELIETTNTFKVFRHGFTNGQVVSFTSYGMLPSGLSCFEEYFVIEATEHTFKVSRQDGGVEVIISDSGKDRLFNLGGEHFVTTNSFSTSSTIGQISVGATYCIKGNIGILEDSRQDISQQNLKNLGVNSLVISEDWMSSDIFGKIKIYDMNWIFARNLGWIYVRDMISRDPNSADYFWFYISQIGWVGTNESIKNDTWFIPSLRQSNQDATGFASIFQTEVGVVNIFVHYNSQVNNISSFYLGGTEKSRGRLCLIDDFDGLAYGYMLRLYDAGAVDNFTPVNNSLTANEEKYTSIEVLGATIQTASSSIQQNNSLSLTLQVGANIDEYLKKNYILILSGVAGSNQSLVNKPWHFVELTDTSLELIDSDIDITGLDFSNAKISFLREFDSDFKKYIQGKYFQVLSNKEESGGKFEIVASEFAPDKFDAIDKKGVIRKPGSFIPPQDTIETPASPTDLILYS